MPIFGKKKPSQDSQVWHDYPDFLDVNDKDDVEWIKQSNDPLVWHTAALACLIFRGDEHDLLTWLTQQPNLDRVTAASMFLHGGNGASFLLGRPLNYVQMPQEQLAKMLKCLCEQDATRTLVDSGIGLEPGWESARQDTIKELADHPLAPLAMLSRPVDRQTVTMPYSDIGEGDLASRKYLKEEMPFLFG